MSGLFIVLEGGEGTGKSTQAALLSSWLEELGVDHVVTREPGGTAVGEAIRKVVLSKSDLDMPDETELFLYLAARAAFVRDVVKPALRAGKLVLADRFSLSTLAYQGYGRGLNLNDVRHGLHLATGGLQPDLYIVFDLSVLDGAARQREGGKVLDRIEREGVDFQQKVREAYLKLAEQEPNVRVVDARGAPEEVHRRVRTLLEDRYPETFARGSG